MTTTPKLCSLCMLFSSSYLWFTCILKYFCPNYNIYTTVSCDSMNNCVQNTQTYANKINIAITTGYNHVPGYNHVAGAIYSCLS